MAIRRVEMQDFLVFSGEFAAEFCRGVNVIIGGNGTGKTTLLKALHWAHVCTNNKEYILLDGEYKGTLSTSEANGIPHVLEYYSSGIAFPLSTEIAWLQSSTVHLKIYSYPISGYAPIFDVRFSEALDQVFIDPSNSSWLSCSISSLYIPTAEMLSHSRGFLELDRERPLPFDKTEIDIIAKAGITPTREIKPNALKVLGKLKEKIGGVVDYDGKDFFIVKESYGLKVPFSFEASGYRKLGLLWKLLRNGLLEPGTVLFWDEPENSLNPELMPVLVDVLLELSRNGVQIFLATHSEMLASYFAVSRQQEEEVLFTTLYKEGMQIKANADTRFDLLEPNNLTEEIVKLHEREIEKGLGGND